MTTPCDQEARSAMPATCPLDRSGNCRNDPGEGGDTETPPAFHLGYRRWLDGLRGLAILLVLAGHLKLIPGGFLGVDVFFVLSGLLITSLLLEEWQRRESIRLRHFYLRRGLRLLPAFFALLLAVYLATLLFRPAELVTFRKEMAVAVCYVANWPRLHQTAMPTLGHTWSLSLEEQFYLLWPMLLYGMLRLRLSRRRIILLVCAGIVVSAALRFGLYRLHRAPGPEKCSHVVRMYCGLDTRADALLVGCLVALLASWGLLPKSRRSLRATNVAALVSAAALSYFFLNKCLEHCQLYYGLFTVIALLVGIILVRLLSAPSRLASPILESAALVGVGRISYALYLFHMPIIHWLRPAGLGWGFPIETLLITALSFAAAVLSYFCIERPCLRLKRRQRFG